MTVMTVTIELWMFYTALSFIFGLALGSYLGQRTNPSVRRIKQLEVELEKTKDLLADYQERVTRHFARTSELFDSFTKDYKSVYQHLADGCANLCDDRVPRLSLEVPAQRIAPARQSPSPPPTAITEHTSHATLPIP